MTGTTMDRVNSRVRPSPSAAVTPGEDELQVDARAIAEALDPELVARLAATARAQGVSLLGRDGLLRQVTKRFLEAALQAEMDEHLGYGKHEAAGRNGGSEAMVSPAVSTWT
jgi:Transposase, Mutator family